MPRPTVCPKPQIKICGITCLEDALLCVDLGVQWLGFNCYHGSKRYIEPEKIANITQQLPDSVKNVGVFVNSSSSEVHATLQKACLDLPQFHGDETPEFCNSFGNYIKAFRVTKDWNPVVLTNYHTSLFLLDAYHPTLYGGTGHTFDWSIVEQAKPHGKIFLAGGLTPNNIQEAIFQTKPYGVDVCGGVEASAGKKDIDALNNLITTIQSTP